MLSPGEVIFVDGFKILYFYAKDPFLESLSDGDETRISLGNPGGDV